MTARPERPLVSVVVPVLNEEGCVGELARRVAEALAGAEVRFELLFVDDGSTDATADKLRELRAQQPEVKTIRFTRSFGHQAALAAGLAHARGDAVITMDGDLQHPPELLPALLDAWRDGADVVQTVRRRPPGAAPDWREATGRGFYALVNALGGVRVATSGAEFRLLDRAVVDAFGRLEERQLFLRGLVPWLGFRETRVEYPVGERFAGETKYSLLRMLRLAVDGILSFSVLPLRLITLLGLLTTLFGIGFGCFALIAYFRGQIEGSGWTSLVVLVLLFGGVQLLSVGVLAEYVGRVYEEVKRRPRYVIDSTDGIDPR